MGWIQERSPAPWRLELRMAKFRDAPFHVEQSTRMSGRRIAPHEYPKRDDPYSEDMGRRMVMFDMIGYLIEGDRLLGLDYRQARNRLMIALEKEGPGPLIHPTLDQIDVVCERYGVTETRDRGGYCVFEMRFLEAGRQANKNVSTNTPSVVKSSAGSLGKTSSTSFSGIMQRWRATTP
jgi:prophage DNA circulation protein